MNKTVNMQPHLSYQTNADASKVTTVEQAESNFRFITNNEERTAELVAKVVAFIESGDSVEDAYAKTLDIHTQEAVANFALEANE